MGKSKKNSSAYNPDPYDVFNDVSIKSSSQNTLEQYAFNESSGIHNLENKETVKYDISLKKIIAAFAGGVVGSLLCSKIYTSLIVDLWTPLVVAIYFLILALFIFVPTFVVSYFSNDYYHFTKKKGNKVKHLRTIIFSFLLIFLVSGFLEFLYELESEHKETLPTSYIFLLDVSDSMNETDESHEVATAMHSIVMSMEENFPFSVYTFSDSVSIKKEMHNRQISDVSFNWDSTYNGWTNMNYALRRIYDDYLNDIKHKRWIGGDYPRVIMMSDGYPSDSGVMNTVSKYKRKGISISTISVKDADYELMNRIAEESEGVSLKIENIENLEEMLKNAMEYKSSYKRTLLSERVHIRFDGLYSFLRILFLIIILVLFTLVLYNADCIEKDIDIILLCKVSTAVVCAIGTEFLFGFTGMKGEIIRTLICVLTSASVLNTRIIPKQSFIHPPTPPIPQKPTATTLPKSGKYI